MKQSNIEIIDTLEYEKRFLVQGSQFIAGMDEVGRGSLAGPVVVACVVMPLQEDKIIQGIKDSKQLSSKRREDLFDKIITTATECVVMMANAQEIDTLNILNATKSCMKKSIDSLKNCDIVLVDAVKLSDTKIPAFSIIKGDAKSYCIGAASIVAKVIRDRLMEDQDKLYPEYYFKDNKGYGTAKHIEALRTYGPCILHRKTFIKNFFQPKQESFL